MRMALIPENLGGFSRYLGTKSSTPDGRTVISASFPYALNVPSTQGSPLTFLKFGTSIQQFDGANDACVPTQVFSVSWSASILTGTGEITRVTAIDKAFALFRQQLAPSINSAGWILSPSVPFLVTPSRPIQIL